MNILNAIMNMIDNEINHLTEYYQGKNRANNVGDALEEYIKDLFANTFNEEENNRNKRLSEVFSYLGNSNNPPDAMLRGGDAIEVKKIQSEGSALALNSSYPKHTLMKSSPMISKACREAEQWDEKDMIYAVGIVDSKSNDVKHLSMVYGLDYCASDECYSKIKRTIKDGVEAIEGVEFTESKELGHINKVDPLGITYMRVRGMWGIDNPWKTFNYVYEKPSGKDFSFMCLINDEKWKNFNNVDELMKYQNKGLSITNVKIKNPDNPAQLRDAKLITFER